VLKHPRRIAFATAAAISGVGLCVFVAYTVIFSSDPEAAAPADRELLDLADDLRTSGIGLDAVKLITDLGSFTTVASLVFAVGVWLLLHRDLAELAALVVGSALVYLAVRLAKEGRPSATARPARLRPGLGLPEWARRLFDDLGGGGAGPRRSRFRHRQADRPYHDRGRSRDRRGAVADLPARSLPVRRGRGLGAGGSCARRDCGPRAHRRPYPAE